MFRDQKAPMLGGDKKRNQYMWFVEDKNMNSQRESVIRS